MRQIVLWTGRVAALLLVLNFTTCFAMPWARSKLPWRGRKPGRDEKDSFGQFQFTAVHRVFAWAAVVAVIVHVAASILRSNLR